MERKKIVIEFDLLQEDREYNDDSVFYSVKNVNIDGTDEGIPVQIFEKVLLEIIKRIKD